MTLADYFQSERKMGLGKSVIQFFDDRYDTKLAAELFTKQAYKRYHITLKGWPEPHDDAIHAEPSPH